MYYSLNVGEWNSVFAVPSSVVDKYIRLAGGNSLKLLLFLLRHGGEEFSEDKLKAELGFTESGELEDAALFWIQRGIIGYSNEEKGALAAKAADEKSQVTDSRDQAVTEDTDNVRTSALPAEEYVQQTLDITEVKKPVKIAPANVNSREIASRINTDPEIQALFSEAEKIYGRPLRPRENQLVISLADHYGLPPGVALMLLSYCVRSKNASPNYIQTAAAGWAEEGIDSVEKADVKLRGLERQNSIEQRLRAQLEMTSGFTPQQKKYIAVWTEEWKFSEEMVLLACRKTIDQIGKWKASYTNKILENWKRDGISDPVSANAPNPKQSAPQTPKHSSSFDTDDLISIIKSQYSN